MGAAQAQKARGFEPRLIDQVPKIPRQRPMKVLCLGAPRTGTSSLRDAFKMIGMHPHHFSEMKINWHSQLSYWIEAEEQKYYGKNIKPYGREEFDKLLYNYDAVEDNPTLLFSEELIKAYPDAKVILTNRDLDAWARSVSTVVIPYNKGAIFSYFARFFRFSSRLLKLSRMHQQILYGNGSEAEMKNWYTTHYARIRELVPKENLLELHIGDGWGPLCEFLEVPEPSVPYPHSNTGAHKTVINQWMKRTLAMSVAALLAVIVAASWSLPGLYRQHPERFVTISKYLASSLVGTFFWNGVWAMLPTKGTSMFSKMQRQFAAEPDKLEGY